VEHVCLRGTHPSIQKLVERHLLDFCLTCQAKPSEFSSWECELPWVTTSGFALSHRVAMHNGMKKHEKLKLFPPSSIVFSCPLLIRKRKVQKQQQSQNMASLAISSGSSDATTSPGSRAVNRLGERVMRIDIETIRLHTSSLVARLYSRVSLDTLRPLPMFLGVNPTGSLCLVSCKLKAQSNFSHNSLAHLKFCHQFSFHC